MTHLIYIFKYHIDSMVEHTFNNRLQQYNFRIILYIGLILSQTQILYNISSYAPIYCIPYFSILYFTCTTFYLLYLIIGYAFLKQKDNNIGLQLYQHIVLPLSVLIITLLVKNEGLVGYKIVVIFMLVLQSLMVIVKIIYFNSVVEQLAQISTINKVIRIVKLNLIAIMPLFITFKLAIVIIISVCQLLSFSMFFFKFTYQKCLYEYIVLVGVFSGVISAVQDIFQTIFDLPYLFVGQITSLYFYLTPHNYLTSVLYLKYIGILTHTQENKHDDDYLAGFLFVQECIFPNKRTMMLSDMARNEGIIQAGIIIQRFNSHQSRSQQNLLNQNTILLHSGIQGTLRQTALSLFQIIQDRFGGTLSYCCFQFLINSGLSLGGQFVSRSLVSYYRHIQKRRSKNTILDRCKYELLYQKILRSMQIHERDAGQIKFIQFSDWLKHLNDEIEKCINNQIKLIQYLTDDDKKVELFPDQRLMDRNVLKNIIRRIIQKCVGNSMYTYSSQFKFLYILYHMCIEKRLEGLKANIKRLFLSIQAQQAIANHEQDNLVVLAGFNNGQIINSNQIFKNHFGVTLNSFSRNNISQFIPTQKQRSRHVSLMLQSYEFKQQQKKSHIDYECMLMVQKEFNNIKLKVLQVYTIATRIYYQNQSGFNYVCCLNLNINDEKDSNLITLLRKDCQSFQNKGFQLILKEQRQVDQLGEVMEVCDIQFSFDGGNSMTLSAKLNDYKQNQQSYRIKAIKTEYYLEQKLTLIERKLLQQSSANTNTYKLANLAELLMLLTLITLLVSMFMYVSNSVDSLSFVLINEKTPVRNAELVRNKVFLQQQIMSFVAQTAYFQNDLCHKFGIPALQQYIKQLLLKDLQQNTDAFIGLATISDNYGQMVKNLFARQFSPVPYLMNMKQNITYQKYIQLMKSQTYEWLDELHSSNLDVGFYTGLFPQILQKSTIDQSYSLYYLMDSDQAHYTKGLVGVIQLFQVLSTLGISGLLVFVMILRIRDNIELINYLKTMQFITADLLLHRMRELKYSLSQLHRLKSNRIQNIDIDGDFVVAIKGDKKQTQNIPLAQFTNWQINHRSDFQIEDDENTINDEDKRLLKYKQTQTSKHLPESSILRVAIYNRCYLLLIIGVLVAITICTLSLLKLQDAKIQTLTNCDIVSQEMSRIQQKYINVVAYNWLKVFSLETKRPLGAASSMFNQAINALMISDYQTKVTNAYSKVIADQVLYGDVCTFFNNAKYCDTYRNGIFYSGFSMLLPFTIKQQLQIDNVSDNYTYYVQNLCDKTWLLFEGVIPMTNSISDYGLNQMNSQLNEGFLGDFIQLGLLSGLLIVLTVWCQYQRYNKQTILREQVLSLDTVSNLYTINQFKPYFNKIYYS